MSFMYLLVTFTFRTIIWIHYKYISVTLLEKLFIKLYPYMKHLSVYVKNWLNSLTTIKTTGYRTF